MARRRRLVRILSALALLAVLAEAGLRLAGAVYLRHLYAAKAAAGADDLTIVCLGESSTAGLWVEWPESYPKQLEALLQEFYGEPRIRVVVPPHVGQNTSQMSNRIASYLEIYHPRLVVVMAGYNNEWSLAESHIGRFLHARTAEALEVRLLVALDGLRLFKLLRYTALRLLAPGRVDEVRRNAYAPLGHPELVRYPPAAGAYAFASRHREAFVALWRDDVRRIARASRAGGARTLLMTYHINPTYLPADECAKLAAEENVPLVRNDEAFATLGESGRSERYVFQDDLWHPTALGYALIARNAFTEIAQRDLLGLGSGAGAGQRAALAALPLAAEFPALVQGRRVDLGSREAEPHLGKGWSAGEGAFRWTEGPRAEILFGLGRVRPLRLRIRLHPFVAPGRVGSQRVTLVLNGSPIGELALAGSEPVEHALALSLSALGRENTLVLELPDARSPASIGLSDDVRALGIAAHWLALEADADP